MVGGGVETVSTQTLAPDKVRTRGMKALVKELGPAGMVQFMQQFQSGQGDYTRERHKVLDKLGVDELFTEIKAGRRSPRTA